MKKLLIKVVTEATTWVTVEDDEDVTQRMSDIYLHGRGEKGYEDKEDIGGNTDITVLQTIPVDEKPKP